MVKSTPRKTGRPIAVHKDRRGNRIVGLMRLKDGRWRASGPEKFTFTEPDEDLAIARFREWEGAKGKKSLGTVRTHLSAEAAMIDMCERTIEAGGRLDTTSTLTPLPDGGTAVTVTDATLTDAQWAYVRKMFLEQREWLAQRIGVASIAWLHQVEERPRRPDRGRYFEHRPDRRGGDDRQHERGPDPRQPRPEGVPLRQQVDQGVPGDAPGRRVPAGAVHHGDRRRAHRPRVQYLLHDRYPLRSCDVRPIRKGGAMFFEARVGSNVYTFTPDQILFLLGWSLDGITPVSPIRMSAQAVGLAVAMERYAARAFSGGNIGGILQMPRMSDEAMKSFVESWRKNYAGVDNSFKVAALPDPMKFIPTTMDPEKGQLTESRRAQVLDICRIWKVPASMLGELEKASYSSLEAQNTAFYQQTILPWLVKLEQELAIKCLLERERPTIEIKFNPDALLRASTQERYAAYMTGRQGGWLSINDVRKKEGLGPVPNGDELLSPLNMAPDRGLRVEVDMPNTSYGRDIMEMVKRRDVRGMSFGFQVRGADGHRFSKEGGQTIREIRAADLKEVSVVANPAYDATSVQLRVDPAVVQQAKSAGKTPDLARRRMQFLKILAS